MTSLLRKELEIESRHWGHSGERAIIRANKAYTDIFEVAVKVEQGGLGVITDGTYKPRGLSTVLNAPEATLPDGVGDEKILISPGLVRLWQRDEDLLRYMVRKTKPNGVGEATLELIRMALQQLAAESTTNNSNLGERQLRPVTFFYQELIEEYTARGSNELQALERASSVYNILFQALAFEDARRHGGLEGVKGRGWAGELYAPGFALPPLKSPVKQVISPGVLKSWKREPGRMHDLMQGFGFIDAKGMGLEVAVAAVSRKD